MLKYPDFCVLVSEFASRAGGGQAQPSSPSEVSRSNSHITDPFLLRQMKGKDATAKGGRGFSHKIEKRIDNTHKRVYKENYDAVKDYDSL